MVYNRDINIKHQQKRIIQPNNNYRETALYKEKNDVYKSEQKCVNLPKHLDV